MCKWGDGLWCLCTIQVKHPGETKRCSSIVLYQDEKRSKITQGPTWLREQEGCKATKNKWQWQGRDHRRFCLTENFLLPSLTLAQVIKMNFQQDGACINSRNCLDSGFQALQQYSMKNSSDALAPAEGCEQRLYVQSVKEEKETYFIHCSPGLERTFLWNCRLPGVCGNLGRGTTTSISCGRGGNSSLGRVCPARAWGYGGHQFLQLWFLNISSSQPQCVISEFIKTHLIIASPRSISGKTNMFTLPWVLPQDGSFWWCQGILLHVRQRAALQSTGKLLGCLEQITFIAFQGNGCAVSIQQKSASEVEEKKSSVTRWVW